MSEDSNLAESTSTWCMVTLGAATTEQLDWFNIKDLVQDVDYYVMDVSPMVFYFFKNPSMATLFKLTFIGM